ncbi:MAG TPA: hypothetical protein VGL39_20635 [Jatrophihabitantaceae bacterium]
MPSQLSYLPVERRRRAAATVGLIATLLVAIGIVSWAGSAPSTIRVFSTIALVAAVLLGLVAWGLLTSVRADLAESRVDAAIASAVASSGAGCGCGHEHDPDEMHVTDACPSGDACAHDCAICLLGAAKG